MASQKTSCAKIYPSPVDSGGNAFHIWFMSQRLPPLSAPFAVPTLSARSEIAPFLAMDVMRQAQALAATGREITHLEIGEPGTPTPLPIRQAVMRALEAGRIPYTQALGLPELREAIGQHYRTRYGVHVPPERVAITTGSSGGFVLAFLALLDAGTRIGIPAPGYPAYRNILNALGIKPVDLITGPQTRYTLSPEAIRAAHAQTKLDAVLMMSPANPTGVLTPPAQLAAIAKTCQELGIWLISDEIYHGLTYEGEEACALSFWDEAVIVNSFSKYFCMTGWRIGWLVLPERAVRPVERLAQSLTISAPWLSQIGALAAFGAIPEAEALKAGYARNRAMLAEALPALQLPPLPMDGAFYAYCDISRHSNDSQAFCRDALEQAGIALTPGLDFDPFEGHRFARLSYAGSETALRAALIRLKAWLERTP